MKFPYSRARAILADFSVASQKSQPVALKGYGDVQVLGLGLRSHTPWALNYPKPNTHTVVFSPGNTLSASGVNKELSTLLNRFKAQAL